MRESTQSSTHELEKAAEGLPGIRRVRAHHPAERLVLRVLVAPERTDDEASRMLRDLAAQRFGIDLAPDAIEILRTGQAASQTDGARRRLMSLTTERLEDRFIARVVLELGGDLMMGDSAGVARRAQDEQRIVAQAVIHALSDVLDFTPILDAVESIHEEGVGLAVVALELDSGMMTGTARVRQNEHEAIARATLDAINRSADLRRHSSDTAR